MANVPLYAGPTAKIDFSESYDTSSVKGKSVLVTGGATGIGQGAAVAFAEAGAYVTIADINEKDAGETVGELKAKGYHAQFIKTDVSSWDALIAAFKAAIAFSPDKTVDIVVPAAGLANGGMRKWLDEPALNEEGDPLPQTNKVLAINFDAVFNTTHLALFYFKNFPGTAATKQIIFVASMGGYTSMTGVLDYCSSKWGVRGLFRALRGAKGMLGEGKPTLRCNLIAPTYVKTNMTKAFWGYMEKAGVQMAEVSDCTDVIMRMASDEKVDGRSACIAPQKQSFDLQDDADGLDAGIQVRDSVSILYKAPAKDAEPRKEEARPMEPETAEIPPEVPAKTNGVVAA